VLGCPDYDDLAKEQEEIADARHNAQNMMDMLNMEERAAILNADEPELNRIISNFQWNRFYLTLLLISQLAYDCYFNYMSIKERKYTYVSISKFYAMLDLEQIKLFYWTVVVCRFDCLM